MKKFSSIAYKYLKVQRKRTVLTCMGIILSVALITGTGTILTSLWDKFYRDAVADTGDYFAQYSDVSADSAKAVASHVNVANTAQTQYVGYSVIAENKENEIPKYKYYDVKGYDKKAFAMFPVKLVEGRLPENANEIVLEKRSVNYLSSPVKTGDTITLEIGDRVSAGAGIMKERSIAEDETFEKRVTKQYTVVGLVEYRYSYSDNMFYAMTGFDTAITNRTVFVKLDSQIGIRDKITQIAKDAGIDAKEGRNVVFNDTVLRYIAQSGNDTMNATVIMLALFIILIIMAATIAVIYNAFNISVLERVVQFGLFRCIGATPAQIKGVILKEAMILAAIGIPIGVICGTAAMALIFEIFKSLNPNLPFADLKIILSPLIIIGSILLGLITIYLSATGPARRAARVSPMEAVRNIGEYKKEKIKKKKSNTGRHILGIQGFMAWRNMGRNRKRVRITVLSMVISIVLFIVVSSFLQYTFMSGLANKNEYASFGIYGSDAEDARLSESEFETVKNMDGVQSIFTVREATVSMKVPLTALNRERLDLIQERSEIKGENALFASNTLKTIGDAAMGVLGKYKKEGNIDIAQMNAENGVILVKTVSIYDRNAEKSFVFDIADIRPGDTIEIGYYDLAGFSEKVKVEAILTQNVLAQNYNDFIGFTMITSDSVFDAIRKKANDAIQAEKDAQKDNQDIQALQFNTPAQTMVKLQEKADAKPLELVLKDITERHAGWRLTNYDEMAKQMQATILIINILFYGFIAIIALIGALNIINTISTNILLRTRELSVLKAIGMTKKGLNMLVYLESIYYSILAAVFGGAIGTGLSWLLFRTGSMAKDIQWTVPWNTLFIAMAGAAFVCLLSGYVPLKRINKGAIIDNIRQEQ